MFLSLSRSRTCSCIPAPEPVPGAAKRAAGGDFFRLIGPRRALEPSRVAAGHFNRPGTGLGAFAREPPFMSNIQIAIFIIDNQNKNKYL